jgi:replication factor C subunit 2/4
MTNNTNKKDKLPFTEKYRPRKLPELVIDPIIYAKVNNIIMNKDVPNLIFTGKSGVGKTSSIHCIAKAIYSRNTISDSVIELNASDDRGIKSVQDTIINFCKKKVEYVNGYAQHKLLILDEADNITPKAQKLISLIMEKYPTTRFAFTCNNSSDIIESIQSRCVIIKFVKPPISHYIQRLEYICKNENIEYDYDTDTFEYIFNLCQKDIRQSINILELTYYTFNKITINNVNMICDVPSKAIFDNLYSNIINKNVNSIIFGIYLV